MVFSLFAFVAKRMSSLTSKKKEMLFPQVVEKFSQYRICDHYLTSNHSEFEGHPNLYISKILAFPLKWRFTQESRLEFRYCRVTLSAKLWDAFPLIEWTLLNWKQISWRKFVKSFRRGDRNGRFSIRASHSNSANAAVREIGTITSENLGFNVAEVVHAKVNKSLLIHNSAAAANAASFDADKCFWDAGEERDDAEESALISNRCGRRRVCGMMREINILKKTRRRL
ncbi:hypothetical protein AVEN_267990-1 [Araneus ventricosus]|uniref:Uncharacterized protein n=1 Tax=Araneus ventricosus TaxID=182803 RepID=A0A4Y2HPL2_ARAVE|nr:hypothetical protein AVEN_267990-1 [Araneus ventricosus]